MYILSQIIVAISDVFFILSMLSKKKDNVIFYLILSTITFGAHYMCLNAWTGAIISLVELVFLIIMFILEKKNLETYNTMLSIITIFVTIGLSMVTWESWISILPMIAMIVYLLGMIFKNVIVVKSGTFIRLILNMTYMFLITSYLGAGLSLIILIFTIVGIVRDVKIRQM